MACLSGTRTASQDSGKACWLPVREQAAGSADAVVFDVNRSKCDK